ncbi:hypothetical protein HDU96_001841 [Phlyctochytrium bullatum]|nr:hypothetical protein HDU96_001841 [Phlyctochytrium bullatum]
MIGSSGTAYMPDSSAQKQAKRGKKRTTGLVSFDPNQPGVYSPGPSATPLPNTPFSDPTAAHPAVRPGPVALEPHTSPLTRTHTNMPRGLHPSFYAQPTAMGARSFSSHAALQGGADYDHTVVMHQQMQGWGLSPAEQAAAYKAYAEYWAAAMAAYSWQMPMMSKQEPPPAKLYCAEFNGTRFPGYYDDFGVYRYFRNEAEAQEKTAEARRHTEATNGTMRAASVPPTPPTTTPETSAYPSVSETASGSRPIHTTFLPVSPPTVTQPAAPKPLPIPPPRQDRLPQSNTISPPGPGPAAPARGDSVPNMAAPPPPPPRSDMFPGPPSHPFLSPLGPTGSTYGAVRSPHGSSLMFGDASASNSVAAAALTAIKSVRRKSSSSVHSTTHAAPAIVRSPSMDSLSGAMAGNRVPSVQRATLTIHRPAGAGAGDGMTATAGGGVYGSTMVGGGVPLERPATLYHPSVSSELLKGFQKPSVPALLLPTTSAPQGHAGRPVSMAMAAPGYAGQQVMSPTSFAPGPFPPSAETQHHAHGATQQPPTSFAPGPVPHTAAETGRPTHTPFAAPNAYGATQPPQATPTFAQAKAPAQSLPMIPQHAPVVPATATTGFASVEEELRVEAELYGAVLNAGPRQSLPPPPPPKPVSEFRQPRPLTIIVPPPQAAGAVASAAEPSSRSAGGLRPDGNAGREPVPPPSPSPEPRTRARLNPPGSGMPPPTNASSTTRRQPPTAAAAVEQAEQRRRADLVERVVQRGYDFDSALFALESFGYDFELALQTLEGDRIARQRTVMVMQDRAAARASTIASTGGGVAEREREREERRRRRREERRRFKEEMAAAAAASVAEAEAAAARAAAREAAELDREVGGDAQVAKPAMSAVPDMLLEDEEEPVALALHRGGHVAPAAELKATSDPSQKSSPATSTSTSTTPSQSQPEQASGTSPAAPASTSTTSSPFQPEQASGTRPLPKFPSLAAAPKPTTRRDSVMVRTFRKPIERGVTTHPALSSLSSFAKLLPKPVASVTDTPAAKPGPSPLGSPVAPPRTHSTLHRPKRAAFGGAASSDGGGSARSSGGSDEGGVGEERGLAGVAEEEENAPVTVRISMAPTPSPVPSEEPQQQAPSPPLPNRATSLGVLGLVPPPRSASPTVVRRGSPSPRPVPTPSPTPSPEPAAVAPAPSVWPAGDAVETPNKAAKLPVSVSLAPEGAVESRELPTPSPSPASVSTPTDGVQVSQRGSSMLDAEIMPVPVAGKPLVPPPPGPPPPDLDEFEEVVAMTEKELPPSPPVKDVVLV